MKKYTPEMLEKFIEMYHTSFDEISRFTPEERKMFLELMGTATDIDPESEGGNEFGLPTTRTTRVTLKENGISVSVDLTEKDALDLIKKLASSVGTQKAIIAVGEVVLAEGV